MRLRLAAAVLAVAVLAAAGGYAAAARWYHAPLATLSAPVIVEVAPGEPLAGLAVRLGRRGLIEHPRLWTWFGREAGKAGRIRAGEYQVVPGTSAAGLLDQLVEGRVLLHPVTLVEGWTVAAALEALDANPVLRHSLSGPGDRTLMARLGAAGLAPEGQFFPDTYLVPRGTSDLDVLKLAHARLEQRLAVAWGSRQAGLPLADAREALVLASIVEKETAAPDERPRIAAVFLNRLRSGMRLQTDPTVIYGLGAAYDGALHKRDLTTDTPYNTYTRAGLPPTPIALVGEASLRAAVQPADCADLYFVATGLGDGRHEFSATLEAHNRAVARYLARLRAAAGRQP